MIPKFSAYWQVINNHLLVKLSDFAFILFLYFFWYYVHPTRCTTRFGVVWRWGIYPRVAFAWRLRLPAVTEVLPRCGGNSFVVVECLMFNVERLKWVEWQIKVYADEKVFVMDCDSNVCFDGFMERWRNRENHRELQLIEVVINSLTKF